MDEENQPDKVKRGILIATVVSFAIFVIAFLALVIIVAQDKPQDEKSENGITNTPDFSGEIPNPAPKFCLTPGCVITAASFLENIEETVNPCDDFFEFACGNYKSAMTAYNHVLRLRQGEISELLTQATKKILQQSIGKDEKPVYQKVKTLYAACMDKDTIEQLGPRPMQDLLKRYGGWPLLERNKSDASGFDWFQTMQDLTKEGLPNDQIISVSIDTDHRSIGSAHIIQIKMPSLHVPNAKYIDTSYDSQDRDLSSYYALMRGVANKLGATADGQLRQDLLDIIDFESKLFSKISKPGSRTERQMSLGELSDKVPQIRWTQFISNMVMDTVTETEKVTVQMDLSVLEDIIRLVQMANKRTVANYIMWMIIFPNVHLLNKDFQNLAFSYKLKRRGLIDNSPRSTICTEQMNTLFGNVLGNMYIKGYTDMESITRVRAMVNELREEFNRTLAEVEWLDKTTKKEAIRKLESMVTIIGFPAEIFNDTFLDEYYEMVTVKKEEYFKSVMRINRFKALNNLKKLRKPVSQFNWEDTGTVAVMRTFRNRESNFIMIPAGIIQGLYWANDRPKYVNYAIMGFMIGHEITHVFGGKMNSKQGHATDKVFRERAQCFVKQYGDYYFPGTLTKIDGEKTSGENIANHEAAKNAYKTYNRWADKNELELPLPGLKYNLMQLFWISYAHNWCYKTSFGNDSYHGTHKVQVNGVVSNLAQFAKDFNCMEGEPMNPTTKCNIW